MVFLCIRATLPLGDPNGPFLDSMLNNVCFSGVKFPSQACSIGFISKGPTAGLLNVINSPEEKPGATERVVEQNQKVIVFVQPDSNNVVWSKGNEDKKIKSRFLNEDF